MMQTPDTSPLFKAYPQFNAPDTAALVSSRTSLDPVSVERHFPTDSPADRIARALGARRATSIKELLESYEFYARTREHLPGRHVVDLCCGHGLTGTLFGLLERRVERVTLVDRLKPPCVDVILDALNDVAPWTRGKVTHFEQDEAEWDKVPVDTADTIVLAVHACGELTDRAIDFAVARQLPLATMPCCYPHASCGAPLAVAQAVGPEQAFDIDRTYRLEAAGYRVRWRYIPGSITPMNRILLATPETET